MELEFKTLTPSPDALLSVFGGKIENGTWVAPEPKGTPVSEDWKYSHVTDNEILFINCGYDDGEGNGMYKAFPITEQSLPFWRKIITLGPDARFKISLPAFGDLFEGKSIKCEIILIKPKL